MPVVGRGFLTLPSPLLPVIRYVLSHVTLMCSDFSYVTSVMAYYRYLCTFHSAISFYSQDWLGCAISGSLIIIPNWKRVAEQVMIISI